MPHAYDSIFAFQKTRSKNRSSIRSDMSLRSSPNVRRADVRETTGWMDVELTGDTAEIERAIAGFGTKAVSSIRSN